MEKCKENKVVPGIIEAREEFPDLDLVFPWRIPYYMLRSTHSYV
jgi:hypothetical protein